MKLLPLQGIDQLRFGDPTERALELFGPPEVWRSHPEQRQQTSVSFDRGFLTFGFDAGDRLTFIAVRQGESRVELWGHDPFTVAQRPPDAASSLRQWLEQTGRRVRPHEDSLGGSFEVPDAGVVFCFSASKPGVLDGVQLVDTRLP
ncbi:MAG TPA: hypothetical protein VG734_21320 [Lacunisphaera sp.]|nr:hypothetical protein [Lacunisphaera sp.]